MGDMKLEPQGDRILVSPIKEEYTKSGLIIPAEATNKDKPLRGEIVAVGETVIDFQLGDIVNYGKYSGQPIKIGEQYCLILKGDDVLTIERREKPHEQVKEAYFIGPDDITTTEV